MFSVVPGPVRTGPPRGGGPDRSGPDRANFHPVLANWSFFGEKIVKISIYYMYEKFQNFARNIQFFKLVPEIISRRIGKIVESG